MYLYLKNTNTILDDATTIKIVAELTKNHIAAEIKSFESEAELISILTTISKSSTNTLVMIGNKQDFETLIGQVGLVDSDIAIGFLDINKFKNGPKIISHDWQQQIEALTHRRIKETTVYSIGSRYFLDNISLTFGASSKPKPILVTVDKVLDIHLPICQLEFQNNTLDSFQGTKPIHLSATAVSDNKPHQSNDLLGGLIRRISSPNTNVNKQLTSLYGKLYLVEANTRITDNLNREYKNSFYIGKTSKKIRLISKKASKQDE